LFHFVFLFCVVVRLPSGIKHGGPIIDVGMQWLVEVSSASATV